MRTIRKVTDISKARKKAKKGGWGLKKVSGSFYQTERLPKPKTVKKSKSKKMTKGKSKGTVKMIQKPQATRKFNGKQYRLTTYDNSKKRVNEVADRLRKGNAKQPSRNARVVKIKNGYAVYQRNK